MSDTDGAWFAHRSFGFGAGLPIAWQGWVAYALLAAVITGLGSTLLPDHPDIFAAAVIGVSVLFLPLAAWKTRGGLKWHFGDESIVAPSSAPASGGVVMSDVVAAVSARLPYWRTAFVLWLMAACAVALVMPYVATLEHDLLAKAAAGRHMTVQTILLLGTVQGAVTQGVVIFPGLWAARRLGLTTPLIDALVSGTRAPHHAARTLLLAAAIGAVAGLALMLFDQRVFAPIPSVAELIHKAEHSSAHPSALAGFMASFYGAIGEEVLLRLGAVSLLALVLRALGRLFGAARDIALPGWAFWTATILAAVLFGLGHLPATAALVPLTPAIEVRAVVLNGGLGMLFAMLYRRFGLEWAMVSHFGADIVIHVLLG